MDPISTSDLTVKVPWGHIAAKTWGEIANNKVLMVHGTLDNAGSFDRLVRQLPHDMYYVCLDLPGHGLSSHFPVGTPLNYFDYILAIRYVLDELKWKDTYYVGHSFGAHLGLLFSLIYPDRVKKLVLLDGCVSLPMSGEQLTSRIKKEHDVSIKFYNHNNPLYYTKDEILGALMDPKSNRLTLEAACTLFDRSVVKTDSNLYSYNRDLRVKLFVIPFFSISQSLYFLNQLKTETLLILATDTVPFFKKIKPEVKKIFSTMSNVKVIEVEGNHDVHNNSPEKISKHISNFLNSIFCKL